MNSSTKEPKPVKERDNHDLLELVLQLHSRSLQHPSKEMHDAYVEARTEMESRLENLELPTQQTGEEDNVEYWEQYASNLVTSATGRYGTGNMIKDLIAGMLKHYTTLPTERLWVEKDGTELPPKETTSTSVNVIAECDDGKYRLCWYNFGKERWEIGNDSVKVVSYLHPIEPSKD